VDAYIFAATASETAIGTVSGLVDPAGPARVALPVLGSHRLVAGIEGTDLAEVSSRVATVVAVEGLGSASTYLATAPDGAALPLPVHATVDAFVGFALLTSLPGLALAVYLAASTTSGVTGAALVTGAGVNVLVEVSASTAAATAALLLTVAGLSGVASAATCVGDSALGTGLALA
jgi:hypothetical protein